MNKKELTEADIRTKFITPAILGPAGDKWNVMTQLREEVYITKGRVIVRGKTVKRGEAKKVDYLLVAEEFKWRGVGHGHAFTGWRSSARRWPEAWMKSWRASERLEMRR